MTAETVGHRVYQIRLANGDGVRNPMPMRDFVELLKKKTGYTLHSSELSRVETGKRPALDTELIEALAQLDPRRRGPAWIAGWEMRQVAEDTPAYQPPATAERRGRPATARELGIEEPASPRKKSGGR